MAGKKRKTTTKQTAKANSSRQMYSVIWFAIAIFLMFVVFMKGQNIWTAIHNFMFGVFGVTAYFYPFLLGFVAVLFAMDKTSGSITAKIVESAVLIMLIGGCVDIFAPHNSQFTFWGHLANAYTTGISLKSGGFFGALIGYPLYAGFGKTGAAITIIILMFVFLMIITGTTLISLFKTVAKPVKAVSAQAESAYQSRAQREENLQENGKKGNLKVIKGFNVDIPVDDIPEKREKKNESLNSKQRKVVSTYFDGEEQPEVEPIDEETNINTALKVASDEAKEESADKIKIDFEKEKSDFVEDMSEKEASFTIGYKYPPTSLLKAIKETDRKAREAELDSTAEHLVEILRSFGVETRVVDISKGPTVTRYELQPCAGVKISKITNLADDIALNLATAGVRIEAPIPNKAAVAYFHHM